MTTPYLYFAAAPELVMLHDLNSDHDRRHLDKGLPSYLEFNLRRKDGDIRLTLTENRNVNRNPPIYESVQDTYGKTILVERQDVPDLVSRPVYHLLTFIAHWANPANGKFILCLSLPLFFLKKATGILLTPPSVRPSDRLSFHPSNRPTVRPQVECISVFLKVMDTSVCPSRYLLLNHWAESYQTCYITSTPGKGVQEEHYFSVRLSVHASVVCPFVCHTIT